MITNRILTLLLYNLVGNNYKFQEEEDYILLNAYFKLKKGFRKEAKEIRLVLSCHQNK